MPDNEATIAELRAVLRDLLPYARDGVRAIQKRMAGGIYPALLDQKLARAESLAAADDGNQ